MFRKMKRHIRTLFGEMSVDARIKIVDRKIEELERKRKKLVLEKININIQTLSASYYKNNKSKIIRLRKKSGHGKVK